MTKTPIMGRRMSLGQPQFPIKDGQPLDPARIAKRSKSSFRWLVLFLSCFGMFGNYYVYDNPTALAEPLKEKLGGISDIQYNLLYTIYSLPNTVLPLAGGVVVDRIGVNTCIIIFTTLLLIGQCIVAFGVSEEDYIITLIGRLVFGFGGESLCVASSALLAAWFKDAEMGFAMAVNISVARMGSVANDQVSPFLKDEISIDMAFWAGSMLLGLCLLFTLLLVTVDKMFTKSMAKKGLVVETVMSGETFECKDIWAFERLFWLLTYSCVIIYGCVLPFNNIAGSFFQDKWDMSESQANIYLGIPFTISAIASPFCGGAVDKYGKRAYLFLFAGCCLMFAHGMMGFTDIEPVGFLIVLGSAYVVYAAAIWPGVALIVPEVQLGTAYGVITSVQNIGLALFPLVVGAIKDHTGGYTWVETFFLVLATKGSILAIFLIMEDFRTGARLNKPTIAKKTTVQGDYSQLIDDDPVISSMGDGRVNGPDLTPQLL